MSNVFYEYYKAVQDGHAPIGDEGVGLSQSQSGVAPLLAVGVNHSRAVVDATTLQQVIDYVTQSTLSDRTPQMCSHWTLSRVWRTA